MVEEAEEVEAEWESLTAQAVLQPKPGEWVSIFDGSTEDVWNYGWGDEAKVDKESVQLRSGEDSGLCYTKVIKGGLTFESQVQFRRAAPDGRAKIGICCSAAGCYYLHLYASGGGHVGEWDNKANQYQALETFRTPRVKLGEWYTLELQRDGRRLFGKVEDRQVFNLLLPTSALPDGDVQLGVVNADVVFKGMRVKSQALPEMPPDEAQQNEVGAAPAFKPEQLLTKCRAPVDADAMMTQINELPVELRGMWWAYAKPGAAGRAELVPEELRRFASFLITARSWQVANPGVETQPMKFRMMARLADVEGLPSYFMILSDELHWVVHGPVAGRWVLIRGFRELGQETDRRVFELMK